MATKELGPVDHERSHALIEDFYRKFFDSLDLNRLLREAALDGFETYEDYEKYGDMFTPVVRRP